MMRASDLATNTTRAREPRGRRVPPLSSAAAEALASEMGRATGALARHPDDGWRAAAPFPMTRGQVRKLHGLIRAMSPPEPLVADLEARIEAQLRHLMRYMQPVMAVGFIAALEVLDLAPLAMGKWRRLQALPQAEASAVIERLERSPFGPLAELVAAARAAVLAPYYDLDEVAEHIGWRPLPFIRGRIALRERLLAGGAPRESDRIGPYSSSVEVEVDGRPLAEEGRS